MLRGNLSANAVLDNGARGDVDPDAENSLLEIKDALIQNIPEHWLERFEPLKHGAVDTSLPFGVDFLRVNTLAENCPDDEQAWPGLSFP